MPKPINIGFVFYSKINLCGISMSMFINDLNKTRMLYIVQYLAIAHNASCFDDRYSSPHWFSKANWKHKAILGIGVIDFFRQKCNFVLNIVLEEEVKTHLKF